MIKNILDLLMASDHYNQSKNIEIAKGRFELPATFNQALTQIKRRAKWHKRK